MLGLGRELGERDSHSTRNLRPQRHPGGWALCPEAQDRLQTPVPLTHLAGERNGLSIPTSLSLSLPLLSLSFLFC